MLPVNNNEFLGLSPLGLLLFIVGVLTTSVAAGQNNMCALTIGIIVFIISLYVIYTYYIGERSSPRYGTNEIYVWLDKIWNDESYDVDYVEDIIIKSSGNDDRINRSLISYLSSLLSNQQSLLVRNRAYFFTVSIALVGIGAKTIVDSFFYSSPPSISYCGIAILLLLISIAGGGTNYFWKTTTFNRGYKVWFIETLLIYIEKQEGAVKLSYGLMEILTYCDNQHFKNILKSSDVGLKVKDCGIRATFKFVRSLFIVCWLVLLGFSIFFAFYSSPAQ